MFAVVLCILVFVLHLFVVVLCLFVVVLHLVIVVLCLLAIVLCVFVFVCVFFWLATDNSLMKCSQSCVVMSLILSHI